VAHAERKNTLPIPITMNPPPIAKLNAFFRVSLSFDPIRLIGLINARIKQSAISDFNK